MTDLLARLKRLDKLYDMYSSQEGLFIQFALDFVKLEGTLNDEQLEIVEVLNARSLRRTVYLVCPCGGRLTESMCCVQCGEFCTEAEVVAVDLCVKCWKQPIGEVCDCTTTYRLEWLQEGYYV